MRDAGAGSDLEFGTGVRGPAALAGQRERGAKKDRSALPESRCKGFTRLSLPENEADHGSKSMAEKWDLRS